ncbi:hypothetical protein TELCIR_12571 [Teladorsagia circumcincta]|uniref:Uncharacterized protein n=1 Tax=Teladorsagia circumcincta TaxID=45464 RepID=A0A2G9U8B2_TELCI|nr:hypothetical protein TELCIR_12571 [Teladorsagia circumcincta]
MQAVLLEVFKTLSQAISRRREQQLWTVIRPVAIYGAECWPTTKEVEARLSVMETKMLRWTE